MKLSELYELSPLGWEEAKRETIRQWGEKMWEMKVKRDANIGSCFRFLNTDNIKMWQKLEHRNDTTLLKEWEAKQIK